MCLYTRQVVPPELKDKLYTLVHYILNVYSNSWFEIKKDSKFHNQQMYLHLMIGRINQQPQEVKYVALKNLTFNSFCLLPENMLYSMVMSDEMEVREIAIKKILGIRKGKQPVKRLKQIPKINFVPTPLRK